MKNKKTKKNIVTTPVKQPFKKKIFIFLWLLAVSLFLFYFSVTMTPSLTLPSLMNFMILLWGGGLAYHVLSELINFPYNSETKEIWGSLFSILIKTYFGYLIAGACIFFGKKWGGEFGIIFLIIGVFLGYLWVIYFILELQSKITQKMNLKTPL